MAFCFLLHKTIKTTATTINGINIARVQTYSPIKKIIIETMYEVASQNNNVVANLPFGNSPLAVATAAKQGIVNILNAIKAMTPLKVIPVV